MPTSVRAVAAVTKRNGNASIFKSEDDVDDGDDDDTEVVVDDGVILRLIADAVLLVPFVKFLPFSFKFSGC